jgi:carbon-monoxide dehydrogenase large subunit
LAAAHSAFPSGPRGEDRALVAGRGRYVTDNAPAGALHAVFVRSPHPAGRLLGIEASAARARPGVRAVFTGADLGDAVMPPINPLLAPRRAVRSPLLAVDAVGWVGHPVALVVATTRDAAQDGAAEVLLEIDAGPEAISGDTAAAEPLLAVSYATGDTRAEDAGRVSVRLAQPRVCAAALEPRAIVACWIADRLTVWLPTQSPVRARDDISAVLGLDAGQVRVIAPDVGGAFGAKASVTPEDLVIAWSARRLESTVAWTAMRGEEFAGAPHGRGGVLAGTLAFKADGRFRSLGARIAMPLGAWLPYSAAMPLRNAARILPGPYVVPAVDIAGEARMDRTAPVNIYRGAGRPEAAILMESLVDAAARRLGMDPVELRRRNLVPAAAMPWRTPTGETLDSGDYAALLELACARFGYAAARQAMAARRATGEVVGIGVACYVEPCGQGAEWARVTLDMGGRVRAACGAPAQGQGHASAFAAIVAAGLGCEAGDVEVDLGDTDTAPRGIGALASRSMAIGGSALHVAAGEVAARRAAGAALPIEVEIDYRAPGEAWSAGCVIAQVAIDADTGALAVERIVWADNAGRIVSPAGASGQLIGGLAQGLGQALMEAIRYDGEGQLLTGSFQDYALPRAGDMPPVEIASLATPATTNALGAKGVGEAGTIGVPAALYNAVADAFATLGLAPPDFPFSAARLWRTMRSTRKEASP